jgi:hypothetical protein
MAQIVSITAYRRNQYDLLNPNGTPATSGIAYGFPVEGFVAYPAPSGTVANGVTMNSIVEVAPTGLNQVSVLFYTTSTVAQINSAANA